MHFVLCNYKYFYTLHQKLLFLSYYTHQLLISNTLHPSWKYTSEAWWDIVNLICAFYFLSDVCAELITNSWGYIIIYFGFLQDNYSDLQWLVSNSSLILSLIVTLVQYALPIWYLINVHFPIEHTNYSPHSYDCSFLGRNW